MRVDRDRQGVIRVFQGASAQPSSAPVEPAKSSKPKVFDIEDEMEEIEAMRAAAFRARAAKAAPVVVEAGDEDGEGSEGSAESQATVRETVIAVDGFTGAVTEYVVSDDGPGDDAPDDSVVDAPSAKKRPRRKATPRRPLPPRTRRRSPGRRSRDARWSRGTRRHWPPRGQGDGPWAFVVDRRARWPRFVVHQTQMITVPIDVRWPMIQCLGK